MHIVQPGMEIDVLKENNKIAHENYRLMRSKGIKSVDFMGSIGAGKTALIIKLAEKLRAKGVRVCAIAGDVTGVDDYTRFEKSGLNAVNCNTGHECHLDANLVKKTLADINLDDYDVIFITTEGDDMVRKHHDIFIHSDVAVLNKIDIADAVDVDPEVIARDYNKLMGGTKNIYKCSVKKDQGLDEILAALKL